MYETWYINYTALENHNSCQPNGWSSIYFMGRWRMKAHLGHGGLGGGGGVRGSHWVDIASSLATLGKRPTWPSAINCLTNIHNMGKSTHIFTEVLNNNWLIF